MKKQKKIAIAITLLVVLIAASAGIVFKFLYLPKDFEEGINDDPRFMISYWNFENYIYKNGDILMPFRLKSPKKIEADKKYPLAVFLHGGGSMGMSNTKQMCGFYINNQEKFVEEESYVLLPQVPSDDLNWNDQMIDTMMKIIKNFILPNNSVDENRIYLSGSSMGAKGSILAINTYPDFFAATMFDSGGIPWDKDGKEIVIDYDALKNMPMLISHGRLDEILEIEPIIDFVDKLKQAGNESVNLKIFEELGHETINSFYTVKENWDWLFSQKIVR